MSRPSLNDRFKNIDITLDDYEKELGEVRERLSIKGKTLADANKDAQYLFFYQERRDELKLLLDYCELEITKIRSRLFKQLTERSQRELSDRAKERYIDGEPKYLTLREISLTIREVYDKYCSIVDAFQSRGYALNNITKAMVAGIEDQGL